MLYLPLLDQRSKFVRCEIHTIEAGQAILALDFLDLQFDFTERLGLILVQISQAHFQDASLQSIVGIFWQQNEKASSKIRATL